jgi:hypothetical protein
MTFRSLVVFPLAFAVLFAIAAVFAGDPGLATVLTVENEAGKALALIGCFAAAHAFERDDYLRRAWLYSGACFVLLLAGDIAGVPALSARLSPRHLELAQGALVLAGNATSVVGTWMLARAWSVAGLVEDDEDTRVRGRRLVAGAIAVSLAITGAPLVHDARELLGGDASASVSIASDLGDTVCLALVAPLMQTALALRGGLLRWPWGLLAASGLAWIVFDAASGAVDALHVERARWLVVTEAWRALACASFFAAGIAQRMAVAPRDRPSTLPEN